MNGVLLPNPDNTSLRILKCTHLVVYPNSPIRTPRLYNTANPYSILITHSILSQIMCSFQIRAICSIRVIRDCIKKPAMEIAGLCLPLKPQKLSTLSEEYIKRLTVADRCQKDLLFVQMSTFGTSLNFTAATK
jgi:hypothetical protein